MAKTSHLPIRYLLALLWAHPILHISTIRVKVLALFCHVLIPSYVSLSASSSASIDTEWRCDRCPPLPPFTVIACCCTGDFEGTAFAQAAPTPVCWFGYVHDPFLIWPYGPKNPGRLSGANSSSKLETSVDLHNLHVALGKLSAQKVYSANEAFMVLWH